MDTFLQDKYFKININGDPWSVYLVREDDTELLTEDEYGSTEFESKEIYIRKLTYQIITHELIHAFIFYTFTETAELTAKQNEEMGCEVVSWNWDKIAKLREEVYLGLIKLRDE